MGLSVGAVLTDLWGVRQQEIVHSKNGGDILTQHHCHYIFMLGFKQLIAHENLAHTSHIHINCTDVVVHLFIRCQNKNSYWILGCCVMPDWSIFTKFSGVHNVTPLFPLNTIRVVFGRAQDWQIQIDLCMSDSWPY
jgi:hypothetical protein